MKRLSVALTAILLVAACSSSGILGGLGDILGSGSSTQPSDVVGTVRNIDTTNQRIDLDVQTVNNLRTSGATNNSIYYDSRTRVQYRNQTYNVTDLERGDQISVRGANDNGRYLAQTITVTRNVRG